MQEDRKAAYTPAARYYVKECSKDKLVLTREEVNVDGPNPIFLLLCCTRKRKSV